MKIYIKGFTKNGEALARKIIKKFCDEDAGKYDFLYIASDARDFAKKSFEEGVPAVFVGAIGIAVRSINGFIKDKLRDIPVIVIDEGGTFVIPILSGHIGGANEIAADIASVLKAVPVITTATDVNNKFAIDLFAKKNRLRIEDKAQIAKVSGRILAEESIGIVSESGERLMTLYPREYVLGVGCRKDTDSKLFEAFVMESLRSCKLSVEDISYIASVDIKKDEKCINDFSLKYIIPFLTFTTEELKDLEGEFSASEFVEKTIGVDNVCERAAIRACKYGGHLVSRKIAGEGMTVAIARRNVRLDFE